MHTDPRVEEWANFLHISNWNNMYELAELIVAELDSLED